MSQDVDGEAMEDYQDNSEQEALEVGDGVELDDVTREPGVEMNQTTRGINVTRTVASQYRETQGQQLAHVYSPGCSARQDRIGTRDMSWPAGMVWCRSSHES